MKSKMEFRVFRSADTRNWVWYLSHSNGTTMARCNKGYRRKSSALAAVESIKKNVRGAKVVIGA